MKDGDALMMTYAPVALHLLWVRRSKTAEFVHNAGTADGASPIHPPFPE
jgi:hypothetical protein